MTITSLFDDSTLFCYCVRFVKFIKSIKYKYYETISFDVFKEFLPIFCGFIFHMHLLADFGDLLEGLGKILAATTTDTVV